MCNNTVHDLVLHIIANSPPPSWTIVQYTQSIQKHVVLLIPGLTSTVPFYRHFPLQPLALAQRTPIYQYPYHSHQILHLQLHPNPQSSLFCQPPLGRGRDIWWCSIHHTHLFLRLSYSHVGQCDSHVLHPQHLFPDIWWWREENEMHAGAHFWFVSLHLSSLLWFTCAAVERTQNKSLMQCLFTVVQMVESDYPIPRILRTYFKNHRWIEPPQVLADLKTLIQSLQLTVKWCILLLRAMR